MRSIGQKDVEIAGAANDTQDVDRLISDLVDHDELRIPKDLPEPHPSPGCGHPLGPKVRPPNDSGDGLLNPISKSECGALVAAGDVIHQFVQIELRPHPDAQDATHWTRARRRARNSCFLRSQ